MNLLLLRSTPSYSILDSSTVSCFDRGPKTSSSILRTTALVSTTTIPGRDRVIDFGKYKGKMLGTLPSNYLNWVSTNLKASDFQEWAQLMDQVLNDPLYRDRIEWELAEKLLNGDVFCSSGSGSRVDQNVVSELLEISERFDWDNEDKLGWSKIDFGLLGTSKGGRIPRRVSEKGGVGREIREKRETSSRVCDGGSSRMRRMERRERGEG
ncbi:unnamed protein product [Ilex paraguariensis]|uniref:Uncharacterized protein n=1 Tax=Ilex paraguariensis TaxID=185542 RepID=A0ABC8SH87_9AQUA